MEICHRSNAKESPYDPPIPVNLRNRHDAGRSGTRGNGGAVMADKSVLQALADKVEAVARAICREACAFYGDPPCWRIAPDEWPNHGCDEPGCYALAQAAVASLISKESDNG